MKRHGDPETKAKRIKRAAAVSRSAVRRYPRAIIDSILNRGTPDEPPTPFVLPDDFQAPLAAAWLGHATVLLHMGGLWILTDPVFSSRIGMKVGPITFGMERIAEPCIDPDCLPHIDLVLISHAHFDHLDKPSLKRIAKRTTTVVTAASTSRLIPRGFGDKHELAWDKEITLGPLTIRAIRPAHWGARTAWDRHRGYNSYVLESEGRRVLFAGDTAYTEAFAEVGQSGGVELGIFGIGAYDPWITAHASPEEVWRMTHAARARHLMPVHHSTFKLSNEPMDEPMQRLLAAAGKDAARIVGLEAGKLWVPAR
jgi:L-ascorbate metabolism protein UlaG (beta-lactamase superfamily)